MNPPLTWVFVHYAHMPLLGANLVATIGVALINFAIAELWVFNAR